MPAVVLLIAVFAAMSVAMAVGWACQRAWNNGGWTDAFWSFSVGGVGVAAALALVKKETGLDFQIAQYSYLKVGESV